jgi:hypothetical protein
MSLIPAFGVVWLDKTLPQPKLRLAGSLGFAEKL